MHILVVDDNADAVEVLAALLEHTGFRATAAYDVPTALTAAAMSSPDLVILDLGLPQTDGYQLALQLRSIAGLDALPIIAVTGYATETFRLRSREAGFLAHLIKPVPFDELLELIEVLRSSGDGGTPVPDPCGPFALAVSGNAGT